MKQFKKYHWLLMLLCMTALTGQSRTIHIDVNSIKKNLTFNLRSMCEAASLSDTVVMTFGKGTYTIDGTIQCWCHTIIKGAGRDKTTILLDKGKDRGSFKAFKDDTFFKIGGKPNNPVSFTATDLTIKLKEHKGIWWDGERCHAIKVLHANRVDIHRVDSYMQNAIITNFDMRVCSNVSVTDCIISNYNNCTDGGNLWLRGEMHNITIKRNKFYKYGKDEALAFFSRVTKAEGHVLGKANRSNILVEDNEFYYGGYDKADKDPSSINHMIVSLYTDHKKSKDRCTTSNFHLRNNRFVIDDVCTRCIYISFDPADSHQDIHIENNMIQNNMLKTDQRYYRQDIEVNDLSSCGDTIFITGNKVKNDNIVINNSGSQGYSFLLMQGGNVRLKDNRIENQATINPADGKSTGPQLVWCGAEGGVVTMLDNVCKGIKYIATVGAGDGTKKFTLNATNNYFEGDTRVYCHKIDELNLNFTQNTLVSSDASFFLQEFASQGNVVFNNNKVTIAPGGGKFMTHWSKTSTDAMRFNNLEVKGNVFIGVKNEQDVFKHITKTKKRTVRNNTLKVK